MKKNNTAAYVEAMKKVVELEGLEAANLANHKALETGLATQAMFQAAARELVKIYLAR